MSTSLRNQCGHNTSLGSVGNATGSCFYPQRSRSYRLRRARPLTLDELRNSLRRSSSRCAPAHRRNDLRVYPGRDVNNFSCNSVPQRRLQVCALNNHYMLLKMPEACWRRNSQIECIVEEPEETGPPRNACRKTTTTVRETASPVAGVGKKLIRCLRCQRISRRVMPAQEVASHQTPLASGRPNVASKLATATAKCLIGEKEIFYTKTKITRPTPRAHVAKSEVPFPAISNTAERLPGAVMASTHADSLGSRESLTAIATQNGCATLKLDATALTSSLRDTVVLEQHGVLRILESDDQQESPAWAASRSAENATPQPLNLQHCFRPLRWLLGPFGGRSRLKSTSKTKTKLKPKTKAKSNTEGKAKKKIHAVVYKTYFLRWTRPNEALRRGFGGGCGGRGASQTESGDHVPPLRRISSAHF